MATEKTNDGGSVSPRETPYAVETSDKGLSNAVWYPYATLVPTVTAPRAVKWLESQGAMNYEGRGRAVSECQALFGTLGET